MRRAAAPMDASPSGRTEAPRLLVGVVTGARGLKGEVWIRSFTADPASIGAYGPLQDETGSRWFAFEVRPASGGRVIARIDGIEDRTQAEALAGTKLFLPRAALPEPGREEYYFADLIGLRAETAAGRVLGTVLAVHSYGAGDSLEIGDDGASVLVPFTRAAVPQVEVGEGRVVVDPPAGLWPETRPARRRRSYRSLRPREKAHA